MLSPISLLQFSGKHRVPVIQQTAMAECGLACLAMVSSFHGHKTDLNSLRRRFPVTLKGVTLKALMETADRLDFATRPLKLDLEELKELRLPAILHWNLNHFVVLVSVGRKTVTIHDPAQGRRVLSLEEVSKHFTGIGLELTPTPGFKPVDERRSMRLTDFWTRITGLRSTLTQVLALSVALQIFSLGGPYFTQLVVDEAIVSRDVNLITVLALGFGLLMLIEVATSLLRSWVVLIFSSLLNIQMASNLFRHLIRLPMSYFENRHIGDTVSRFQSLHKIRAMLTTGFIEAFVDGGMSIMLVVLMFFYSPQLAFVVLGFTLAYLLLRLVLFQPFRDLTEENIINAAKEQSNFMETVRGIQSVKLFGKELDRQSIWQSRYADLVNTDIRLGKFNITFHTANNLLFGLENIVVISIAANTVLDVSQGFTVGMLYAFVAYKRQFTGKAQSLINMVIEFKMLKLHLERIADIAKTPIEADLENYDVDDGGKLTGALSLNKLSYSYTPQDAPIFHDLELSVKAGESIALIGPSGVGKTTLLKVMLGLLEPQSGDVTMEIKTDQENAPAGLRQQEIRELGLSRYRSQIAAVMQEDQLMSGTIADNICFFDTQPDHTWIEACAHLACLLPDIQAMPMGFNSLVGDMGTSLSGGQKQRLMLARALYRRPRILFLDEASSHLDVRTEAQVNAHLNQLGITRIVIAHRQATIDMVEKVYLLQGGKLLEQN